MLLVGLTSCTNVTLVEPYLGAPFYDRKRDLAASEKRLAEFDEACVNPKRETPPRPVMSPVWCAWTMEADKVIRANNALRRD